MMKYIAVFISAALAMLGLAVDDLIAAEPSFDTAAAVMKKYCATCHSGDTPKGDLNLATLAPDFAKNGDAWKNVFDRLTEGSMPPAGKPRPTHAEQAALLARISLGLTVQQAQKTASEGRARLRRLNRNEYANTLRDLLGATVDIETLPEDGTASGFDNVDGALDLSATLLERYLETADAGLDAVFVKGPQPESLKRHTDLGTTKYPEPGLGSLRTATRVPATGIYKMRFAVSAVNHDKPTTLLIYLGDYGARSPTVRLMGGFDVPGKPTTIEIVTPMLATESFRVFSYGTQKMHSATPPADAGPGMVLASIDLEGPLHDVWPPAPTTRLLGNVDLGHGSATDAEKILRTFISRAFRRPVTDEDLAPFFAILKSRLDKGYTFEAALRVALKAVLCSPDFLYLSATPGKLNDFDLAARLSYFLWSSTPDDVLFDVASRGDLGKMDVLRQQVERMLKDAKAQAFTEHFTGQWLSLRNLKATTPDKNLYPDFDDLLEFAMLKETHLFFDEILEHDRSVLEFVHSDWSILNERLATHYKIPGIAGNAFRKVALPTDSHRGGVMTQAAVLRVTANGTITSPVTRGAWVLDRILGTPAPPPPKDVPAIEPDVRGSTTLREQLARHKQIASCAACHAKIDPPGNALENFDVIGGWRENYRSAASMGARMTVTTAYGRKFLIVGPKVDAADEFAGGQSFADIDGFKRLVLENPDQIARGLAEKLMSYATGHGREFADRATIDTIVSDVKTKNYGFRSMIHAIVQSELFRSK